MQITIKVKYNTQNPRLESFGNNRFLVYVSAAKEDSSGVLEELCALFSKHFGVPAEKIELRKELEKDIKVLEIG